MPLSYTALKFECALIIKNELFPIIPCEKSKSNICHQRIKEV